MSESLEYQQADGTLQIFSTLGDDALLLTAVSGEETLSSCFVYTIEFYTAKEDADIKGLIGKPVTLWLQSDKSDTPEPINGFVRPGHGGSLGVSGRIGPTGRKSCPGSGSWIAIPTAGFSRI